jgi:hypothetical protein
MEEKQVVSQISERAPAATGEGSKPRYPEPRSAEVIAETLKFRHTLEVPKRHVTLGIPIDGAEERRRWPDYARFGEDDGCCSRPVAHLVEASAVAVNTLSLGNLKEVLSNERGWFLDDTVQVNNIWVPYGEYSSSNVRQPWPGRSGKFAISLAEPDRDISGTGLRAAFTQAGSFSRLWSMLFLLAILLLKPAASSGQAPQATGPARPCASSWNTSAPRSKKKPPKNAPRELQESPACIELSASALDIQEYLQFDFRNQHWTIVEEHLTEDSWTFSLAMSKDDLLGATRAGSSSVRVEWRSGIALVQISSSTLADGFTRTVVRARFRGYGEAADKFAPQRQHWELESNGTLEASIVSTLKARFKAAS